MDKLNTQFKNAPTPTPTDPLQYIAPMTHRQSESKNAPETLRLQIGITEPRMISPF